MSDFKVIEQIGQGRNGLIYKAKNTKDNQIYAIKKIFKKNEKILKEENIMKKMKNRNHPNIMKYYDKFEFEDTIIFILEYAQLFLLDHIETLLSFEHTI